jgi:hypothetical protein
VVRRTLSHRLWHPALDAMFFDWRRSILNFANRDAFLLFQKFLSVIERTAAERSHKAKYHGALRLPSVTGRLKAERKPWVQHFGIIHSAQRAPDRSNGQTNAEGRQLLKSSLRATHAPPECSGEFSVAMSHHNLIAAGERLCHSRNPEPIAWAAVGPKRHLSFF